MVAYSFQARFSAPIQVGHKQQTIRGHRRRHARPGELIQLYTGMRTRHCRKIIADPVCIGVDEVRFDLRCLEGIDTPPASNVALAELLNDVVLEWNGKPITGALRDVFAIGDGFASDGFVFRGTQEAIWPFHQMVMFWMAAHGPVLFEGVAIRWEGVHAQP